MAPLGGAELYKDGRRESATFPTKQQAAAWAQQREAEPIIKKTADEIRTSNTTLANDSAVTKSLSAATRYHIRGKVFYSIANGKMDFKYAWAYTGNSTS